MAAAAAGSLQPLRWAETEEEDEVDSVDMVFFCEIQGTRCPPGA
jgi:hypothetical protein